jgi:hypothetical protein
MPARPGHEKVTLPLSSSAVSWRHLSTAIDEYWLTGSAAAPIENPMVAASVAVTRFVSLLDMTVPFAHCVSNLNHFRVILQKESGDAH